MDGGWLERARDFARRGEVLLAVDHADQGLAENPDDIRLQHVAVLALARAGALDAAARRYVEGPLAHSEDREALVLGARIAKDLALRARGKERVAGARRAARRYADLGGAYPLANAATLSVLADERDRAVHYANEALAALRAEPPSPWTGVTAAEALIVLGRIDEAAAALTNGGAEDLEPAAAASAYRQLALLCGERGIDLDLLQPLRGPGVLHFCGHLMDGQLTAADEQTIGQLIRAELEREPVASAYGALAAGGDVLIAEALLDQGAELHVVLPCGHDVFVEQSVRPWGERWVDRFGRCLAAASTVTVVTPSAHHLDDSLLGYSSELAMGLALLRARWLHAESRQLAVWDGAEPEAGARAGTAVDVAKWRARLGRTAVIGPPPVSSDQRDERPSRSSGRRALALLFADVAGYTKVHDEALPRFSAVVMTELAGVLERHAPEIVTHNTWGDAVSVATRTAEQAARLALDMQETITALDPVQAGLPGRVALRLGAHVGPVYVAPNPARGAPDVVGEHVNRTARLEPVTPPGEVYVTDSFAAALELAGVEDLSCDYVGHLPGAKDIGRLRMHRLRRTEGNRSHG